MSAPIRFVTRRFAHHAAHSGYDRILDWIPGTVIDAHGLLRATAPLPDRLFAWTKHTGDGESDELYGRASFLREARAAVPFWLAARGVFFFPYADNDFRLFSRLPNPRGQRIVATFHRPPSVLTRTFPDPSVFGRLDRVILLGECQRAPFASVLDPGRVTVVPHGVDTTFFVPGDGPRTREILFVGHYLRDFDALRDAARLLAARAPSIRIIAVTRPRFAALLAGIKNLEIRTDLDDEALRQLYQTAALLLLPLRDAVANNTILEALASGLPIVTTDVGAVGEYVDDASAVRVPLGSGDALADAALAFLADPDRHARATQAARRLAVERFEVRDVAARTRALLQEVAQG